jgi:hypothetical protein
MLPTKLLKRPPRDETTGGEMAGSLRRDAFGNEERFRKLKMRG